jgi:hypothetical protein
MSVELLDSPRFYGFRVRRQMNGETYQEYFSLKADGKKLRGPKRNEVKLRAEKRDEELARLQNQVREKNARTIQVDRSGQIRGILFRLKREKSGSQTPVFQIGVMSQVENKIVNTTVSVNLHGLEGGWQKAVDFFCLHKKISKRSSTYRKLIDAQPSAAALKKLMKEKT